MHTRTSAILTLGLLVTHGCGGRTPGPRDQVAPIISDIAVTGADTTGATVSWRTDEATVADLHFGPTIEYGDTLRVDAAGSEHRERIDGLPPSSITHFEIVARDLAGNETHSDDGVLVTAGPAGTLDATFGTGGVTVIPSNPGIGDFANGVDISPDGTIYIGGTSDGHLLIAAADADGNIETSFGTSGIRRIDFGSSFATCYDLTVQPDNKIVCSGADLGSGALLLRVDATGQYDAGFGADGVLQLRISQSWELLSEVAVVDGELFAAGAADAAQPSADIWIGRWDDAGNPIAGFARRIDIAGGIDIATAVAADSAGRVLVAGHTEVAGAANTLVMRFDASGALDTGFGTDGVAVLALGAANKAYSLAVTAEQTIVVAGSIDTDATDFMVARLTNTGDLDESFGSGGIATATMSPGANDTLADLVVLADGSVVAVGQSTAPGGDTAPAVVCFLPNGELDLAFGDGGRVIPNLGPGPGQLSGVDVWDGRIVVAGQTENPADGLPDLVVARFWP